MALKPHHELKHWCTALLAFCVSLVVGNSPLQAGEVLLAVAANFTDASRELLPLFEKTSGHHARVSFGSTGKLYAQIEHGAPYDLFLVADQARPARAEATGLAVAGSRFTYATGTLVMWSPTPGLFEDGEAWLRSRPALRIAIANPATAPYGLAARQVMEHLAVWEALAPRLARGDSIAQTFQFTATGNAKLGFIALSQLRAWQGEAGSLWRIPAAYYPPIAQQAVLLMRGRDNPAAHAFLDFLKSAQARAVISAYGYGVE